METNQPFYDWEKTLNERDKNLVETAFSLMFKQIENFRKDFPLKESNAPKEYQCFLLDGTKEMCHIEDTLLFESDNLAHAGSYVYNLYKKHKIECCVYQPRHQTYREYYRNEE